MAKCRSRRTAGRLLLDTGGVSAPGKDRRADRKELHPDLFHTASHLLLSPGNRHN